MHTLPSPTHSARSFSTGPAHRARGRGLGGRGRWAGPRRARGSGSAHAALGSGSRRAPSNRTHSLVGCASRGPSLRTMARLLVLLGPAGRVGARVQPRATWLLSATAPCAPPPSFLPLLRPGPDSRLLSTARGDGSGRQVSLPIPRRPDPGSPGSRIPGSPPPKGSFARSAARDRAPPGSADPKSLQPRKRSS